MSSSSSSSSPVGSPPRSPLPTDVATNPPPASQIQMINIKSHIPTVLDLTESNYGLWRQMFLVVLTKFGLMDHIDGSTARGDSDWVQNDFAIVSWIYLTISNEILRIVQTWRDTTHSLWHAVRSVFLDNAEARSVYISAEFRNMYQGDMTALAYCTRMKELADMLGDLGAPVQERDLVLNILRGLNPRLHGIIPTITMHPPLPSFIKVRSDLQLEEHRLAQADRLARHAAFMAQHSGMSPSTAPPVPGYFGLVTSAPPAAPPAAPPSAPPQATWDQQSLIQALNAMAADQ